MSAKGAWLGLAAVVLVMVTVALAGRGFAQQTARGPQDPADGRSTPAEGHPDGAMGTMRGPENPADARLKRVKEPGMGTMRGPEDAAPAKVTSDGGTGTMRGPENPADVRLKRVKEPTCIGSKHDSPCGRDRVSSRDGDRSYLRNRPGGPPADDTPVICDRSENGRKAREIVWRNNGSSGPYESIKDMNGANPGCYSANFSFNGSGHAAAVGYWNGAFRGVGRFSPHGR